MSWHALRFIREGDPQLLLGVTEQSGPVPRKSFWYCNLALTFPHRPALSVPGAEVLPRAPFLWFLGPCGPWSPPLPALRWGAFRPTLLPDLGPTCRPGPCSLTRGSAGPSAVGLHENGLEVELRTPRGPSSRCQGHGLGEAPAVRSGHSSPPTPRADPLGSCRGPGLETPPLSRSPPACPFGVPDCGARLLSEPTCRLLCYLALLAAPAPSSSSPSTWSCADSSGAQRRGRIFSLPGATRWVWFPGTGRPTLGSSPVLSALGIPGP